MKKLECNVSDQTAADFRRLIRRRGVSITEGVRRAVAVWTFVEDEVAAGNRLCVVEPGGTVRAVALVDDDEEDAPLFIAANPWRDRLKFNCRRRPFPYLLHRWEVMADTGPCHGFFTHRGARRYIAEYDALPGTLHLGDDL